ncbi:hypothetical protein BpHYR1_054297 [Brachionus plicatilis]|uniref:Secreted protein n=1 Tax=Brachionus plicatilis TaxID=10195 RepID=A0A3M7QTQ3_BRAPC|nr:hypothetical protein BpHYR1_054297 [Brachionus plicatilis]
MWFDLGILLTGFGSACSCCWSCNCKYSSTGSMGTSRYRFEFGMGLDGTLSNLGFVSRRLLDTFLKDKFCSYFFDTRLKLIILKYVFDMK